MVYAEEFLCYGVVFTACVCATGVMPPAGLFPPLRCQQGRVLGAEKCSGLISVQGWLTIRSFGTLLLQLVLPWLNSTPVCFV